jgi:hypothetical protein
LESMNLSTLAEQLATLREELSKHASERDQYAAIVAIDDAATAAKQGDKSSILSNLKKAGSWALEVATKIGETVAADALKEAIGLK